MGGLLPGVSGGKTTREIESKASSGKLSTLKMLIATGWKNFVIDGSKDLLQWGEDVVAKTRIALGVALSDEWNGEGEELHGVNPSKNFQQKRKMFKHLFRVGKVCNDRDFIAAQGLYTNNFFSENYDWNDVDSQFKKHKDKLSSKKKSEKTIPPSVQDKKNISIKSNHQNPAEVRSSHACYLVADAEKEESTGKILSKRLDALLHRKDKEIEIYKKRILFLESKESLSPDEEWQLRDYKYKLESNKLNPLCFDEDERIAKAMDQLTKTLIKSFSIDKNSIDNIVQAYELSRKTGKKLILNCNHAGHSDAYVYTAFWEYLIQQEIIPGKGLPSEEQKKLRFWCGLYMAFTPGIRKFLSGIRILLGPGLQDMDYYAEKLKPRNIHTLFTVIKQGRKADPLHEVGVIFSQGGRGPYGGMKESAQEGTYRYLNDPDTIIVDVHLTNTDKIYMADSNGFATYNRWSPQAITATISQPYVGGTKDAQQIYDSMIAQRDELQPGRKGAQIIHSLYESIKKTYTTIAEIESKIQHIPDIKYVWENKIFVEELGNIDNFVSQDDFVTHANDVVKSLLQEKNNFTQQMNKDIVLYNNLLGSDRIGSLVKEKFLPIPIPNSGEASV